VRWASRQQQANNRAVHHHGYGERHYRSSRGRLPPLRHQIRRRL
jgi:hypothetical protein